MKVVFIQNVENHRAGDVKEVTDGYARNYLLPRGLARAATAEQLKLLQSQKDAEAKRAARAQSEAEEMARQLSAITLSITAKAGAQKRLHGSITSQHIADELRKQHHLTVDKRDVALSEPIKRIGDFEVPVHVGHGLEPKLKVTVTEE
ncbi:MAG: 50S ribosomal protein L9 [Chloroflexota bacterium]|nr:50S ribosomal protein L9 [Chloroflexota bacterium]